MYTFCEFPLICSKNPFYLPFDPLVADVAYYAADSDVLNFLLLSKQIRNLLTSRFFWKERIISRLVDYNIPIETEERKLVKFKYPQLFFAKVFFDLQIAFKTRDDLILSLTEDFEATKLLDLSWKNLAAILFYNRTLSPRKMASIFNLEGNLQLKYNFIAFFNLEDTSIPRVLKNLTQKIFAKHLSPQALLGLLKKLADAYWAHHPELHAKFLEPDAILTLFYAMITIEADFSRTLSYNKMSKREFIRSCQCTYNSDVFDDDLLGYLYDFVLLEGLDLELKSPYNPVSVIKCYAFKNLIFEETPHNSPSLQGELSIIEIVK